MQRHLLLAGLALVFASAASAGELPIRKAGLWELKTTIEGGRAPQQTIQHCTDPETDKLMTSNFGGASAETCSKTDIETAGDTITIDSVCTIRGAKVTGHTVVTGSFEQAYTVKVTSKREGGPAIPGAPPGGETHMTIEAKWLGPCRSYQKPGDIIMPSGMTINIRNMGNIPGMPGAPGGPGGPPAPAKPKSK